MTRSEIGIKYMKDRAFGKITEDQYAWLIKQGIEETQEIKETLPEPSVTSESEREGMTVEEIEEAFNPSRTTHTDKVEGTSQKAKLLNLLKDLEWHGTDQIQLIVYGADKLGVARIAARIHDLTKDGFEIESKKTDGTIWSYKMKSQLKSLVNL